MWKWILRIFLILVVLIIVVVLFFLGPIVKPPATAVASSVMGVDVTMDKLSVSPLKGSVGLMSMRIGNPQGYETDHFVNLEKMSASSRITSFLGSVVSIKEVIIDGLSINIESKGGKTNMKVIMDNLDKSSGGAATTTDAPAEEGKKFRIDRILLKNISVTLTTGVIKNIKLTVSELEVKNIGTDQDTGTSLKNVIKPILTALASKIAEGSKELGKDVQKALGDSGITEGLSDIGKSGAKAIEKATDPLKNLFK